MTVNIFGIPVTIKANIQGRPITVTLPIPVDATPEQLASLLMYIEHSDETIEVKRGQLVEMETGIKGFRFDVVHFSDFYLMYASKVEKENKLLPYINGYPDGTFKPNVGVTRAEMAIMIARYLTNGAIPSAETTFTELGNSTAKNEIEFVKQAGLFNGTTKTTFNPNGIITRAEMATVAARWIERECAQDPSKAYCQEVGAEIIFTDVDPNHWAAASINKVSALGIMIGNSDKLFHPNDVLTRAQAVKVLNRLFERPAIENVTKSKFLDVPATHWAIGEIESAATEHVLD